jgi:hypothetical protein
MPSFSGQVNAQGRLVLDDEVGWRLFLAKWHGRRIGIEAEPEYVHRSIRSNKYYFGRVVKTLQGIWSRGRTAIGLPPYTKHEAHSVVVQVCAGSEPGPLPGSVLAIPTRTMPQDVFSKLIDDARQLAWDQYEVNIPPGNEPEWL